MAVSQLAYVEGIREPSQSNHCHQLTDILFIAGGAVSCGAASWDDIELYGRSKQKWLKNLLELPHGMPSDDTFRRVFSRLVPSEFEPAFRKGIQSLVKPFSGDIIPIDGKRLRGACQASTNHVIHLVSAWSCQHQLVLGLVKTEAKSSEHLGNLKISYLGYEM